MFVFFFRWKNHTNISPSAGIGRQCELKIRWFNIVNVQVVSWILISLGKFKEKRLVYWDIVWHKSRFVCTFKCIWQLMFRNSRFYILIVFLFFSKIWRFIKIIDYVLLLILLCIVLALPLLVKFVRLMICNARHYRATMMVFNTFFFSLLLLIKL